VLRGDAIARPGVVLAAILVLGGCGSGGAARVSPPPKLPTTLAAALAARSDAVAGAIAAGDACRASTLARTLQQQTIAAINRGQVAGPLQEPLQATVNDLVERIGCAEVPVAPPARQKHHGKGKHKGGHGKKHEDDE
jgi:hypothetical protein